MYCQLKIIEGIIILVSIINFVRLGNLGHEVSTNELNSDMLYFLSQIVGRKYKRLARNLDMEDDDIDEIEHNVNNDSMKDKCFLVFEQLLVEKGSVEWNQVKKALESFYQTKIISKFITKYPKYP